MKDFEKISFCEIVEEIKRHDIILPDFQRGFVWKDKNKQKALIASVLTKLPIGTILFLETSPDEYGCKKIGHRQVDEYVGKKPKIKALLDGQQRLTVLTAFFTSILHKVKENERELVSPSLARRYFLKIPTFRYPDRDNLFGLNYILLPKELKKEGYPKFLTSDIIDDIVYVERKSDNEEILYKDVDTVNEDNLYAYCVDSKKHDDSFLIPLFYLYGSNKFQNENHKNRLKGVLSKIASKFELSIIEFLRDETIAVETKDHYIKHCFEQEKSILDLVGTINYYDFKKESSDIYKVIHQEFEKRIGAWADQACTYFESCIDKMELYQITVESKDKLRAIDIYENLNKGGKALDIFDLILAKSAKKRGSENLITKISKYIIADHRGAYEKFIDQCQSEHINMYRDVFIDLNISYSASHYMGCIDEKNNEFGSAYCEALMDMLGIIHFFSEDDKGIVWDSKEKVENLKSSVTKKDYLLNINSEKIEDFITLACIGLDRACVFLQIRCGIRKVSEIHYKLMFVAIGYILLNDEWFSNKKALDYLECWYWSSIFSGEYKVEQNKAFNKNLQELLKIFQNLNKKPDYIISLCNQVFCDNRFATEEILLMKSDTREPEEVIKNTICQFYLAKTYHDLLMELPNKKYIPQNIHVFQESLEKHHIMPVGDPITLYKNICNYIKEQEKKGDITQSRDQYQSPLNFALISKSANQIIANIPLKEYASICDTAAMQGLGIYSKILDGESNISSIDTFLKERYNHLCNALTTHFRTKLNENTILCGKEVYHDGE